MREPTFSIIPEHPLNKVTVEIASHWVNPAFPYADLWEERSILSVANLTRADGEEFFPLAETANFRTETVAYPLEQANEALDDLWQGRLQGAAVLVP